MRIPTASRAHVSARAACLALLLLSACTDQAPAPPTAVVPDASHVLGVLTCAVKVPSGEMSCVDASGSGGPSLSASPGRGPGLDLRTIGGQGTYVRLTSSGISNAGGVFSMNVTVQNLANLAMGTADGATRHGNGLQVFFAAGPTSTGAGNVTVANPTGTGTFLGASQPYFQYGGSIGGTDQDELGADGVLASAEWSAPKSWQFNLDPEVTAFTFGVYVSTETPPGEIVTVAPQVSAISEPILVPGDTVTLTGINFYPAFASNLVTFGGVAGRVVGGGATSLDVVVPCTASGTVAVQVQRGVLTGVPVARPLQVAQRTLAVGESVVVTDASQAGCNEIMPSGGASRYMVAVYNADDSPGSAVGVQISGDPNWSTAALVSSTAPSGLAGARLSQGSQLAGPTSDDRHTQLLERNREQYRQLRAHFAGDARMRPRRSVVAADPVEPAVTRNFHVPNINANNFCSNYYVISATRVYYDGKIAIYEDDATPAGLKASANALMADYYDRIGDQFNADMEPIIRQSFGNPLVRDAVTDNNGVMIAIFTPRINSFGGVAGFVVSCDQYPDDDAAEPAVGGPYAGTGYGASNFGEYFYAYQPTVVGTGYTAFTPDQWYRTIRSTFIHESKHVASMAARVANGASSLEDSWLEEGTARHAEELWGRQAVDGRPWKGNTGYGSAASPINLYCDARTDGACATTRRPAVIMQRHFFSLYTQMAGTNGALLSPFGRTPYDNGSYFYAISWSLARYAIDRYGASDAAFLTALTQSTTTGTANLSARAGVSIEQLLGGWALALAADDYPGLASPGLDVQMPTWNFRDIYAGIHATGASTTPYPLVPTALGFGPFPAVTVEELYGGGVRWFEFSGVHTQPQLVRLLDGGDGTLASTVRVAIVRVQ